MKKQEIFALALTVLFLGFAAGFLIGYGIPGGIALLPEQNVPSPTPSPTVEVSANLSAAPASTPAVSYRLNINTATAEELTSLPGIGDKLAAQIVAYRTQNGAFNDPADIMKVSGIGEKKYAAIQDLICVAEDGR
ncbi:MAG: helix-hairpin-helix domain-containing protein [Clostridia bacterium]|nr:helix-hairpin-helix domain-containing protein [Clostridia bacterium]